jgi:hypothetical protein
MPNHCQNTLIITAHTNDELDEVINHLKTEHQDLSFTKIAPPPNDPAYRDEPSQAEAKESPNWWHRWNTDNWGTKWDCYEVEMRRPDYNPRWEEKPHVIYQFQTAWAPPSETLISYLSHLFPQLTVVNWYEERGMDFAGHAVYLNGEQTEFKEYKPNVQESDLVWKGKEAMPEREEEE